MVYNWKAGSCIKADAQTAGEVCAELEKEGRLTPEELVNESREEDAPLHGAFTWDDNLAAEKYRTYEARHIICCIVRVEDKPQETEQLTILERESGETPKAETRAFFNIDRGSGIYEAIGTILDDEQKHAKLLDVVKNEIKTFRRKYANLTEFAEVFAAIDKL